MMIKYEDLVEGIERFRKVHEEVLKDDDLERSDKVTEEIENKADDEVKDAEAEDFGLEDWSDKDLNNVEVESPLEEVPDEILKNESKKGSISIYLCNECDRTFESTKPICPKCNTKFGDIEEQQGDTYKTIAKGITDEDTARRIAREKGGHVVEDDEEEGKFAVVVKEALGYRNIERLKARKQELEARMKELDKDYRREMNYLSTAIDQIDRELENYSQSDETEESD